MCLALSVKTLYSPSPRGEGDQNELHKQLSIEEKSTFLLFLAVKNKEKIKGKNLVF